MTHALLEQDTERFPRTAGLSPSSGISSCDTAVADATGSEKRLEDRTVKELRILASQLGIRGRSKLMHKEELICVIRRRW